MRTLGNILWHFPFFGFINAFFTYILGLLLTVTVVAAPLGLGVMELGKFYLGPFGRAMVRDRDLDPDAEIGLWKAYSWLVMILWFPFGLFLAATMVVQAFLLCCTIIGIPLAIVVAKATGTVFNPVGKRCVLVEAAEELRRRAAVRELNGLGGIGHRVEPVLQREPVSKGAELTLNVGVEDREAAPSRASLAGSHGPQLTKGLKLGLMIGVPIAALVFLGPKVMNAFRSSLAPIPSTTVAVLSTQKPANLVPATTSPSIPTSHSGAADVVDTATLNVNGQRVPLAGLRPVEMPQAASAARAYLAQVGDVKCDQAPVGGWRCIVVAKGLDVAEVFALSGFAKAATNAPNFIRNAESMARESRRGVWGAS